MVPRGSTFEVYCTFSCKSKKYIYSGNPPQKHSHQVFNDTTIYLKIDNLTSTTTFSCSCEDKLKLDPCGQDISTGCKWRASSQVCDTQLCFFLKVLAKGVHWHSHQPKKLKNILLYFLFIYMRTSAHDKFGTQRLVFIL